MSLDVLPFGVAHYMALAPLFWLACLWAWGELRDRSLWWLAGVFAVSWLADTASHWVDPKLISAVYPVSQAAIVSAVLLKRDDALNFLLLVAGIGVASLVIQELRQPNVLRAAAWGGIVGIVLPLPLGKLRASLLVAFGAGLATWIIYAAVPGWTTWGMYQVTRLMSILLFCWAAYDPRPSLTLAREAA